MGKKISGLLLALLVMLALPGMSALAEPESEAPAVGETAKNTVTVDFGAGHEAFVSTHFGKDYKVDGAQVTFETTAASAAEAAAEITAVFTAMKLAGTVDGTATFAGRVGVAAMSSYKSDAEADEALAAAAWAKPEDRKLTAFWQQHLTGVTLTVQAPNCGDVIMPVSGNLNKKGNPENLVTLGGKVHFEEGEQEFSSWKVSTGTMLKGNYSYTMQLHLVPDYGYAFPEKPLSCIASVTGGTMAGYNAPYFLVDVTAVHEMGDPVRVEPTCTLPGSLTTTCKYCTYSRAERLPTAGHDWEDPVYTWAEDDSYVLAERVCRRDSSHKERERTWVIGIVTKKATALTSGEQEMVAVFVTNPAFVVQRKVVTIPPLEITYTPGEFPSGTSSEGSSGTPSGAVVPVPSSGSRSADSPQTGTDLHTGWWAMLAVISLAGAGAVGASLRRRRG